jgi:riboflavin biosynthesis pyrimidine reductase
MVMGLLRAIADVVIIGAGTLSVDRHHVWTAERIFPGLAGEYRRLRAALGKRVQPQMVVVTASGQVDLGIPMFASNGAPAMIVTTSAGEKRLRRQRVPESVEIRSTRGSSSEIHSSFILEQALRANAGKVILVEGGPKLLGTFYAEHALDEQFLTLAPQIAGRDAGDQRLSLAMGQMFAPRHPLWGTLTDLRRGGSHLFLRYSFPRSATHA